MSVKSILCAYSGEAARGSGLAHAIRLAQHHGAHLTGVLERGRSLLERHFAGQIPETVLEQFRSADDDRIAEVARRFQEAAGGLQSGAEFAVLDPETDGSLPEFAHAFDLIVTGPHSEAADEAHMSAHPDLIALRSGRPVLVVPDGYQSEGLADRALVAWDGKRSAARAINGAMDILSEKAGVTVLSVGKTPRGTDRLVDNMRRHGVAVTARTVARSGAVAGSILAEAARDDARLIVMGAFEHSKFSHDLLGGVTTDVIRDARVPTYLEH